MAHVTCLVHALHPDDDMLNRRYVFGIYYYFQMIVRVFGDGASTEVPVTPETTTSDVIECCRDPGEESCNLYAVCPEHGEIS
ncbi:hypothetical protein NQ318_001475 [Aromia moschata]|uniref:Ras association domain-containing protein n=1 Tax=Aromia moschata TaxID=1265417 RepID=A0AAV8XFQ5_9CUCU|nr:hypothetical protein NQ318_001475 [Aromia moschata]